ncbi:DNA cytosine methyltransferase [Arthrobacter sp. UM1]|uniref:DNA cytosine methyltransferase n=1 Tax=Arthrobacter sp. UM1 TaxID=2766776 RepID=UPI001CF68806|nr:DNA cytosine methyltransferase [Arthrobacter sp. UM1]
MTTTDLLTATEAAKILGVSVGVVTRLSNQGRLRFEQVGARKVFRKSDLFELLNRDNLIQNPQDHYRKESFNPKLKAISFFSGAGGLDVGLENAGIESILYCEMNKECRMTLAKNRPNAALIGDISKFDGKKIREYARLDDDEEVDIMHGGPPCQAFSTAGARRAFDDARGNIFLQFLKIAKELRPRYLVIENVRGLLSTPFPLAPGGKPIKGGALKKVLDELDQMNYSTSFNLYNSANFGAAQIRERVIIIAKREGAAAPFLTPTHSDEEKWGLKPWVTFDEATAHLEGTEHDHLQFPERRLQYFRMLKEGQYWTSLPSDVQAAAMGKAYGLTGGRTGFYRRIAGNRPSPTLVTSPIMPATDLCHPRELRPLSAQEYKAVQGFPETWWIAGSTREKYRQIGNAVPVKLAEAIGRTLINDMTGNDFESSKWDSFPYSRYRLTSSRSWKYPG